MQKTIYISCLFVAMFSPALLFRHDTHRFSNSVANIKESARVSTDTLLTEKRHRLSEEYTDLRDKGDNFIAGATPDLYFANVTNCWDRGMNFTYIEQVNFQENLTASSSDY